MQLTDKDLEGTAIFRFLVDPRSIEDARMFNPYGERTSSLSPNANKEGRSDFRSVDANVLCDELFYSWVRIQVNGVDILRSSDVDPPEELVPSAQDIDGSLGKSSPWGWAYLPILGVVMSGLWDLHMARKVGYSRAKLIVTEASDEIVMRMEADNQHVWIHGEESNKCFSSEILVDWEYIYSQWSSFGNSVRKLLLEALPELTDNVDLGYWFRGGDYDPDIAFS